MEQTKKANPAPLGLLGFGMTTILLNLHNAGAIELSIVIAAMGFALGGLAQLIAGILEFKHGNTFGGTAFTAYGLFWWSLVIVWGNNDPSYMLLSNATTMAVADNVSMGFYLLLWGIFTAFMFLGTLKHNTISKIVFGSLALLFFMLALADFTELEGLKIAAGVVGILCGLSALYSAMGQIVNAELDKKIFPL